jgi:hypothetical protein
VQLDREVDVSRGCVLLKGTQLQVTNQLTATLLWMDDEVLTGDKSFFVKLGTKLIPGRVTGIQYAIDVNSGEHKTVDSLQKNEIARCDLVLSQPVVLDTFAQHKTLGELILIDRITNATSACGVVESTESVQQEAPKEVTAAVRADQKNQKPYVVLTESLEAAKALEQTLVQYGRHTMTLSSPEHVAFALKLLGDAGLITLVPTEFLTAQASQAVDSSLLLDYANDRDTALERLLQ